MMRPTLPLVVAALLVGGCAHRPPADLYVVVPAATDGHVGAVTVDDGATEQLLDRAYLGLEVDADGGSHKLTVSPQRVAEVFGSALRATPIPPTSFSLQFVVGSGQLTPESQALLPAIRTDIAARRSAVEIAVVGHTDRVGDEAQNQALSEARAATIRDWLVTNGVDRRVIATLGRGERDPLVPTADGVNEPRNRRVVVTVR